MKNTFTVGSQYGHIPGPPVNEDYAILIEVSSANSSYVKGYKLWDVDNSSEFIAENKLGKIPEVGSKVIFHRTPSGWICFPENTLCYVVDTGDSGGNRVGKRGKFDAFGNFVTIGDNVPLVPFDANYHQNQPPWKTGRIYAGVDFGSKVYVYLPGYSEIVEYKGITLSGTDISLALDYQGNVVEFFQIFNDFWEYDGLNNTWTQLASGPPARWGHVSCWVTSGPVYVFGGYDKNGNKLNDLWRWSTSGGWVQLADAPKRMADFGWSCDEYQGDTLMSFWGSTGEYLIYGPNDDIWCEGTSHPIQSKSCFGGYGYFASGNEIRYDFIVPWQPITSTPGGWHSYYYNDSTGETGWRQDLYSLGGDPIPVYRNAFSKNGRYWIGGKKLNDDSVCAQIYLLGDTTTTGTFYTDLPTPVWGAACDRLDIDGNEYVLIFGGVDGNGNLHDETLFFSPNYDAVVDMAPSSAPAARWGHTITNTIVISTNSYLLYLFGGRGK
ncbi:MAG: hypothetical protein DRI56_03195 [Chloroflexota bacterium]|nr:MAG: hypothetical protein DRI56_03195 [Chloroflexota bacterium]